MEDLRNGPVMGEEVRNEALSGRLAWSKDSDSKISRTQYNTKMSFPESQQMEVQSTDILILTIKTHY